MPVNRNRKATSLKGNRSRIFAETQIISHNCQKWALLFPRRSSRPSQPHTGPLCRNLRARSPQGATNVRPPRGHLPEEALHFCWVTSAVFSGAFL
ncbi:hypothetical protein ACOMHN_063668 [Nucella lapillus]